ncbi:MAG: beta-L-arabinofuranosidase domain-containing protein [Acidobacteriota bacterium]
MSHLNRRTALKMLGGAICATTLSSREGNAGGVPAPLPLGAMRLLPLGAVRPRGWLARQLRLQADGMGGHLDEFWPDVGSNSGWLGGTGESWERGPYFLDGLVPLAYLLDDPLLKAKAQRFVDWTLDHQRADGMIGPAANDDWWPRMAMVKALAQYFEVTHDARVLPVLTKYFHYQLQAMPARPLTSWGKYRWQDEALVVEWLFILTRDPKLLSLISLLQEQGFDWDAEFAHFPYEQATPTGFPVKKLRDEAMQRHGVNNSQALKAPAIKYLYSGDRREHAAFTRQITALDTYHGVPNGMFSCDEHLAGREPQHGSELCSVVETMFSLEIALAAFGDGWIGDRIEKLAFNALPGTFTNDMWAHQYDQQSNQIEASLLKRPWSTNGPESNLYGLEPNFGCCTANFHQGWPKFTTSLWMSQGDNGIVAALYAPSEVRVALAGTNVRIVEETDYPFRNSVKLMIHPEVPATFELALRIPEWSTKTKLTVNGKAHGLEARPGTFAKLRRLWQPGDVVEITFEMLPRVTRWFNRSIAVERGPLVFSYSPGEEWVKLRDRPPTADWEVHPKRAWNYALAVDEGTAPSIGVEEFAVEEKPFCSDRSAVTLTVKARRLDGWKRVEGVAAPPPLSPVHSATEEEELALVPYAAAKLRVTAFPSLLS